MSFLIQLNISNSREQHGYKAKKKKIHVAYLMIIVFSIFLNLHVSRFTFLRSMNAAWIASAVIWMKEIAVGVVFFLHKELSKDGKNQSVCFEHYPMHEWEYPINFYRFSIGFMFPLAILSVWYTTNVVLIYSIFYYERFWHNLCWFW